MSQQLAESATSFGPSAWSGSGFGAGEDLEVGVVFQQITDQLNQGASGSLESLVFNGACEGIVGGTDAGHLIVDIANSADAKLQNLGKVDLRVEAYGSSKVENFHTGNPRALSRCLGGEFETTSISAGRLTANQSTVIDDFFGHGGRSWIEYETGGSTISGETKITGGYHELKRRAVDIDLSGGTLVLDHDPSISSWGTDVLNVHNGLVIVKRASIPTINLIDGEIDFRQLRENVGSAMGGTAFNVYAGRIYDSPLVSLNLTYKGAIFRNDAGIVEYGGGFKPFGG